MDYILFGIQGSGKGTQGKLLAEKFGWAYFETGGELRRLASENSELGQKVKSIIDAGNLVPNEVVMEIVENFVRTKTAKKSSIKNNRGFYSIVFDGIPRNAEQNASLTALLIKLGRTFTGIYFELSREEAEDRLLKRRLCSVCKTIYPASFAGKTCACGEKLVTRADDNAESIRRRLDIFFEETLPVTKEWKSVGRLISVNAAPPIEEVTKELLKKIKG